MAQQSYPIVEQPVTAEQWSTMAQGDGDGIIDRGNWPFWITSPSSVTDTVTVIPSRYKSKSGPITGVQAGEAQLSGFYFRITSNEVLKVPPVSKTTKYWIALQYDPLRGTDPAGPIKLAVFSGDLDRSQGKTYLVLWALTRSPNQTLETAWASRDEYRPRVSPQLTVSTVTHLPVETETLVDTVAFIRDSGSQWRAETDGAGGIKWSRSESTRTLDFARPAGWSFAGSPTDGIIFWHTREGRTVYTVEVDMERTVQSFTIGTSWTGLATILPEGARSVGFNRPIERIIRIGTNSYLTQIQFQPGTGDVFARQLGGSSITVKTGDVIRFDATWVR